MTTLLKPIAYLEDMDFDSKGNLVNKDIPTDVPVVIMLQTSWCPHCTSAKPAFQQFANKYKGKVFCATIQSDGDRASEKKLGERIKTDIKKNFRGYPDYVLYENGKNVNKEINGRSLASLETYCGLN